MSYYTEAEHAGTCGAALTELVLTAGGEPHEAIVRQPTAVEGYGEQYARSRVHAEAQLATLTMVAGDPDEAAGIGQVAVDAAASVRSGRTAGYLRAVHRTSARHAGRPAVAEMRARLADALLA